MGYRCLFIGQQHPRLSHTWAPVWDSAEFSPAGEAILWPCAWRRQRIWGSISMTRTFMADKACWLEHMALNASTGLDPEGVKLRASEGLLGVDYFFPGYAVWAKLIEAAARHGLRHQHFGVFGSHAGHFMDSCAWLTGMVWRQQRRLHEGQI